jgi:hypothetical protein
MPYRQPADPQFRELEMLMPEGEPLNVFRHYWDGISGATVLEMGKDGRRVLFKSPTDRRSRTSSTARRVKA